MPTPNLVLYESGSSPSVGVPVTSYTQIDFGMIERGTVSAKLTLDLWNDRNEELGADTAVAPRINAYFPGLSDFVEFFAGTTVNGFKSFLEGRSCGAFGVAGDYQTAWTAIRPDTFLELGDMPAHSKRILEFRLNIPYDAEDQDLGTPVLRLHY